LIFTLSNASTADRRQIMNTIKNHNTDNKKVKEVIRMVKDSGGMDYAIKQMNSYELQAYEILETFPDSVYKKSLKDLIRFTIERQY